MARDVDELRTASELTRAASRQLRADSEHIRRWSQDLLLQLERHMRSQRPAPPFLLPPTPRPQKRPVDA